MLQDEQRAPAGGGGTRDGLRRVEDACLLGLTDGLVRSMPLLAICRRAAALLPNRGVTQAQARMRKHQAPGRPGGWGRKRIGHPQIQ